MLRRIYWIAVLLLLLSLPALACGVFGGDDAEPTAVPEAAPAEVEESAPESTPEPTSVPAAEESSSEETAVETVEEADDDAPEASDEAPPLPESALSLNTIDELPFNSYSITMVLEVTGTDADGAEISQGMNSVFAFSKEPAVTNIYMDFFGIDDEMDSGTIEMAQVEGTSYMVVPEMGCITTSGGNILDENPFTEMLAPDQFLDDMGNVNFEGNETINGIETRHYSFDQSAMTGTDLSEINEAEGHVYIAKDGDFLVRLTMDASGQIDFFDEGINDDGNMYIEINLTDIDVPVEAAIPEACAAGGEDGGPAGAGSEFPIMDDATEVTSFAGVLSYQTASSQEEVLAFYDEALTAEGWVQDEASSFVTEGNAIINYTQDGVTLSLTFSASEDSTEGNYVILLSDEE